MNRQIVLIMLIVIAYCLSLHAQKILVPVENFSHKKVAYVYKENGDEFKGTIQKVRRKKGLIKEIQFNDEKGEMMSIPTEEIKYAFLPQSGFDRALFISDLGSYITQSNDSIYNRYRFWKGYAIFEKAKVEIKKEEMLFLMQLLNPGKCARIKVYHAPFKRGEESYYISKDGEVAYKLYKKKFKKRFEEIFGDCTYIKGYYRNAKFSDFEEVVFEYNDKCRRD